MSEYRKLINIIDGRIGCYGLEYQLYKADGTEAKLYYNGVGYRFEGKVVIEVSRTNVLEFTLSDTPTYESVQRELGREHARKQQRMREPKNVSYEYRWGWRDEWEKKKALDKQR